MIFKLVLNTEIHLYKSENPSLLEIREQITKHYPQVSSNYSLIFIDNEGDSISISQDDDLKVLIEDAKQQTIKLHIQQTDIWECKNCTFANSNVNVCQVCQTPRNNLQQCQQPPQNHWMWNPYQQPPPPPLTVPYGHPQFGFPPGPSQFGFPPGPPQAGFPPGPPPGFFNPHNPLGNNFPHPIPYEPHGHPEHHQGHHRYWKHSHKLARMRQIMQNPEFRQQKEKLQQLLKDICLTFGQQFRNQEQQHNAQQVTSEDQQRVLRLSEVLNCSQEQAREYLELFRELTLDEIVMMIQNSE